MNTSCKCKQPTKQQRPGSLQPLDEYVEGVICKVSDLNDNEPKVFPLDKGEVLVVKQNNHISALGTTCTHYGAPLVNSVVGDGRLRCQWHGACFNLFTGDIEEFPGFDSLPCHQVYLNNNDVIVRAKKSELQSVNRIKPMAKNNPSDLSHFVVVGGGPAGAQCAEVLRQEGFGGQITLVCKENCLPYDRIKYSKVMDFDIAKAEFRTDSFYKEYDINVLKRVEATELNIDKKTISLNNNNVLTYDKLFIATGSKPRRLDVPGGDLKNVATLRTYEDAHYISNRLGEDKDVVILGSSFIAMEAATFCVGKVKKLTIVMREDVPFASSFGTEVGRAVKQFFEEKGIAFVANSSITKLNGDDSGNVVSIELANGEILKADLVLLGIGSECCTKWIINSGINILPNSAVEVNEYLQTSNSDIFVGGDIAFAPVWSYGKKSAIGHFGLAHYHGKIAALNMLGKDKKLEAVPYFWTMLFDKGFRYAGHGEYDEIIYKGNVKEFKYVAFYLKKDEVVSVSSCGMDPVVSQFAEHLARGKKLFKHHLEENPLVLFKKFNT